MQQLRSRIITEGRLQQRVLTQLHVQPHHARDRVDAPDAQSPLGKYPRPVVRQVNRLT